MRVILASQSPRRRELLKEIIPSFDIMPQDVDEQVIEKDPKILVQKLAKKKINNLDKQFNDAVIISSDTIVFYNGKVYGKPKDEIDAVKILRELSNNTHEVYTGVCVCYQGEKHSFFEQSFVKFKDLTNEEIVQYVRNKKPLDKAGAYGIQDNDVVESYLGSYSNIVGLPQEKLKDVLRNIGVI